ncbi:hypothetical protein EKK58_09130 [Candidatus Dependentiae bacterium]|nr:MAG: hypothetical protein EKK58_09130 [Candidatus Dependentiae bacterium]
MTLVAGIDPGTNGAVGVYCTEQRKLISVEDLPTWNQTIGKKQRKRIDPVALMELFDTLSLMGVELVVLEAVGGRPRQGAAAGFVFGYTVGLIYMSCMYNKLPVETIPPGHWKKVMRIPGKGNGKGKEAMKNAEKAIKIRVNEIFPNEMAMFTTPRGAYKMDRADASLIAKFGGDHVINTIKPLTDVELKLAYRHGDTGA